jgi:Family of unknown function (DUF5696)
MSKTRDRLAIAFLAMSFVVVNPTSSQAATAAITITSTGFTINIQSGSESVTYQWVAPDTGSLWTIGSVFVTDSIAGASPQGQIALGSHIDWIGPSGVLQSVTYQTTGTPAATLSYLSSSGTTHLTLQPAFDGNFAVIRLSADRANIQDIYLGQLPSDMTAQGISVPYYSQAVNYFRSLDLFENGYFDAFASSASSLTSEGTFYATNQNGVANGLKDTWRVSVSQNIMNVLPFPRHPASPYMSQLAGRMVFDIGGGSFATIASQLAHLGDYGINHCVAIVGDWQRLGYDNGLPLQYPASGALGGDAGMRKIGSAAKANSCLFALHENYTDYYPNYPGYNAAATMRNQDGSQALAWLNQTTGIQSFATKPGLFVTNAQTQSPLIHKQYGTNATFIDVNSSAVPWWRQDYDSATVGSAGFGAYRDGSVALWAYERNTERGPVLGEGRYHWFWSGLLDSVEAQFGAESTPITNGLEAPLFVDFDLMRIHPLQVNYGMGYYARWMPGGSTITSTTALDAYRMQEIVFGHSPYLTDALWSSVPRALLEQNLVSPLATRYALQTPNAIAYNVDGAWSDASGAAKTGEFSLVQVSYPNGDTVLANSGSSNVTWNSLQIPQYGWAAIGNGFVAYTAILGGQVADYSQTPTSIYANARNLADVLSENTLATPSVVSFTQTEPNVVQIQLAWDVNSPAPGTTYQEFIHFVSSGTPPGSNALSGGAGGSPVVPTSSWTMGQKIVDKPITIYLPPTMPDGTYDVRVGLYSGSQRAVLYGNNDGNQRYTIGSVTVSSNGSSISFTAIPIAVSTADPRMNSAGAVVDFGTLRTDGMVMLQQTTQPYEGVALSSYPRSRDVVIQINSVEVPTPASLACDNGDVITPVVSGNYWQVDLRGRKFCTWSGVL